MLTPKYGHHVVIFVGFFVYFFRDVLNQNNAWGEEDEEKMSAVDFYDDE